MWFNATESLEGCHEFEEKVFKIFEKERPSRIRDESLEKISKYMTEKAMDNKAIHVEGPVNPVTKSERTVTTKKRDATGEILFISQSFGDDEMIRVRDV